MSNLATYIKLAEGKWMPSIYSFLHSLYKGVHLPSHDVSHHERVWQYGKELLLHIYTDAPTYLPVVEQALIACMFHDSGLIIDHSERHGHHSKVFCLNFLRDYPHLSLPSVDEVLLAIEHHDDKSLKLPSARDKDVSPSLVDLLSTADDLDAFGLIGVFRYLEIYTLRGISLDEIPDRVLTNLENRFQNFRHKFSDYPNLVETHRKRFLETRLYFESAVQPVDPFTGLNTESFLVAKNLVDVLVDKKMDIKSAIAMGLMSGHSAGQVAFYMGLKDELGF